MGCRLRTPGPATIPGLALCCLLGLVCPSWPGEAAAGDAEDSFGVFVCAPNAQSFSPLSFACEDTRLVRDDFVSYGGMLPGNALLLVDADWRSVLAALQEIGLRSSRRPGAAEPRVVVYVEAHGDEHGLHLGRDQVRPEKIVEEVERIAPDALRILMFNACRGGRLGASREGPDPGPDWTQRVGRGTVEIYSSEPGMASWERSDLRASVFGHCLHRCSSAPAAEGDLLLDQAIHCLNDCSVTLAKQKVWYRYQPQEAGRTWLLRSCGRTGTLQVQQLEADDFVVVFDRQGHPVWSQTLPALGQVSPHLCPGEYRTRLMRWRGGSMYCSSSRPLRLEPDAVVQLRSGELETERCAWQDIPLYQQRLTAGLQAFGGWRALYRGEGPAADTPGFVVLGLGVRQRITDEQLWLELQAEFGPPQTYRWQRGYDEADARQWFVAVALQLVEELRLAYDVDLLFGPRLAGFAHFRELSATDGRFARDDWRPGMELGAVLGLGYHLRDAVVLSGSGKLAWVPFGADTSYCGLSAEGIVGVAYAY